MFGFLLIDKPKNLNSFGIVVALRKLLNVKRIGYAGTLDPLASGLMIVAIGEATKMLSFLEKMDKVYDTEITFGATSATYDAEGQEVSSHFHGDIRQSLVEEVLKENFLGERDQVPPVYSAVKIGGKHAYDLARNGQDVLLQSRKVSFYDIQITRFVWPRANFLVHCSSGTYIRSFAHDLGQVLMCGGYVSGLRRTKIGKFSVHDAVDFDHLTAQIRALGSHKLSSFLLQPQQLFLDWKQVCLQESDYRTLSQGGFIENVDCFTGGTFLAMFEGQCVGILELTRDLDGLKFLRKFHVARL